MKPGALASSTGALPVLALIFPEKKFASFPKGYKNSTTDQAGEEKKAVDVLEKAKNPPIYAVFMLFLSASYGVLPAARLH
jgi:hypothetical protein